METPRKKHRTRAGGLLLAAGLAVGTALAAQQPTGSQGALPPGLSAEGYALYEHAKTVLDWTPEQIEHNHALRGLRPAPDTDELSDLLNRVGKAAVAQFKDFPRVACSEQLESQIETRGARIAWRGHFHVSRLHHFHYIIIPKHTGDLLSFSEYRTDKKGDPVDITKLKDLLIITSNFTSGWLYLNPAGQLDSRFREFGLQRLGKRDCFVVGFAQIPGVARNVGVFRTRTGAYEILVQGLAWIDRENFHILRMQTVLLAPRTDFGLEREDTTVNYLPVHLPDTPQALWLPRDATVMIVYHGAFIRNTHRYSDYKLFRVHSVIKPEE